MVQLTAVIMSPDCVSGLNRRVTELIVIDLSASDLVLELIKASTDRLKAAVPFGIVVRLLNWQSVSSMYVVYVSFRNPRVALINRTNPLMSLQVWAIANVENEAPLSEGNVRFPLLHPRTSTFVKSSTGCIRPTVIAVVIGACSLYTSRCVSHLPERL